jgi:hypothetical protein
MQTLALKINVIIGCGVYPALCLLNTSCEQNITKINFGNRVVAIASRPIRCERNRVVAIIATDLSVIKNRESVLPSDNL